MSGIMDSSLAAKAAMLGVLYGLERMTGNASQAGFELQKYTALTGQSSLELQKLQHAFMYVGVSGDEVESTLVNMQSAMAEMNLGQGGGPAGLQAMAEAIGGLDPAKLKANDSVYMLKKLTEYMKIPGFNPAIVNQIAKTFGLSNNLLQGMRLVNYERDKGTKQDWLTKKQEAQLGQVRRAWADIWYRLDMVGKTTVAKHGLFAVGAMTDTIKLLTDAGNELDRLATRFPELEFAGVAAGLAIGAAFAPWTTAIAGLVYILSEIEKYREGKQGLGTEATQAAPARLEKTGGVGGIVDRLKNYKLDILKSALGDTLGAFGTVGNAVGGAMGTAGTALSDAIQSTITMGGRAASGYYTGATGAMNITINNYGVDHKDLHRNGGIDKASVDKTARTLQATRKVH